VAHVRPGEGFTTWSFSETAIDILARMLCAASAEGAMSVRRILAGHRVQLPHAIVCIEWTSTLFAARIKRWKLLPVERERFGPLSDRWIPIPRILHPYRNERFYAKHPK
jgi:hypothetical protein